MAGLLKAKHTGHNIWAGKKQKTAEGRDKISSVWVNFSKSSMCPSSTGYSSLPAVLPTEVQCDGRIPAAKKLIQNKPWESI